MPQVQVLRRIPESVSQGINQAGGNIANILLQKQAMKLRKLELDDQIKRTENATEKLKLTAQKNDIDFILKAKEQGVSSEMTLKALVNRFGQGDPKKGFTKLTELYDSVAPLLQQNKEEPSPQDLSAVATAQKTFPNMNINRALGQTAEQQVHPEQAMENLRQQIMGTRGNQARTQALTGGVPTQGAPKQTTQSTENYAQDVLGPAVNPVEQKYKMQIASGQAVREKELASARNALNSFQVIKDKAVAELGGTTGTSAIEARMKGFAYGLGSQFGTLPAVQAFMATRKASVLSFARLFNGGRPSDKDFEFIEPSFEHIMYPDATNAHLREFWDAQLENGLNYKDPAISNEARVAQIKQLADQIKPMVEADKKLVLSAQKAGYTPEQIEAILQDAHKSGGVYAY